MRWITPVFRSLRVFVLRQNAKYLKTFPNVELEQTIRLSTKLFARATSHIYIVTGDPDSGLYELPRIQMQVSGEFV